MTSSLIFEVTDSGRQPCVFRLVLCRVSSAIKWPEIFAFQFALRHELTELSQNLENLCSWFIHFCVCAYVWDHRCICACEACGGQRLTQGVFLNPVSSLVLRWSFSLNLKLTSLARCWPRSLGDPQLPGLETETCA